MKITVTHKGEDYYAVTLDGEDHEVTLSEGIAIKAMLKALRILIIDSRY